jgi:hypothetical protein
MMVMVIFDDDEIFLCNNKLFPIDLAENVRLEDFGRKPSGIKTGLEEHEPIHPRTDHIDVMGDQEDCQS